jgi:hypothetical protein
MKREESIEILIYKEMEREIGYASAKRKKM